MTLIAETTNGSFLCAEMASNPRGKDQVPTVPEDLGKNTAKLLLEEIHRVCFLKFIKPFKTVSYMEFISHVTAGSLKHHFDILGWM